MKLQEYYVCVARRHLLGFSLREGSLICVTDGTFKAWATKSNYQRYVDIFHFTGPQTLTDSQYKAQPVIFIIQKQGNLIHRHIVKQHKLLNSTLAASNNSL